MERYTESES
jgi:hypothetical protein